jgi:hypothetical protein
MILMKAHTPCLIKGRKQGNWILGEGTRYFRPVDKKASPFSESLHDNKQADSSVKTTFFLFTMYAMFNAYARRKVLTSLMFSSRIVTMILLHFTSYSVS